MIWSEKTLTEKQGEKEYPSNKIRSVKGIVTFSPFLCKIVFESHHDYNIENNLYKWVWIKIRTMMGTNSLLRLKGMFHILTTVSEINWKEFWNVVIIPYMSLKALGRYIEVLRKPTADGCPSKWISMKASYFTHYNMVKSSNAVKRYSNSGKKFGWINKTI